MTQDILEEKTICFHYLLLSPVLDPEIAQMFFRASAVKETLSSRRSKSQ